MKKLGCLLTLIGLISFALSIWIFGGYIQQKVATLTGEAQTPDKTVIAHSTPIELNQRKVIEQLQFNSGRLCQLAIGFLFEQEPTQKQSFEYEYQVLNLKGQKIFIDQGILSTKDSRIPIKEQWIDNKKAMEFYLEAFPIPEDKNIEVRFTLSGQSEDINKLQLRVYTLEHSTSEISMSTGIFLLSLSFAVFIIGLALFLIEKSNELEEEVS